MKTKILVLSALTFSLALSFIACKKEKDDTSNNDEVAIHSDDQSRFASEIDAAANDADLTIESSSNFTGRYQGVQGVICDASVVVNTSGDPKTITITYDGTNCAGNRKRTGSIVISMAQNVQWKNAGASVMVNFQNLKITRVSDNKSITINGSQTYTNVSGGLLINLPTLNTITHSITSSGLSITFDNGTQRTWQVSKQRVFTFVNNSGVITTTGTHTDGAVTNIAEWGTNRFGKAFTTAITEPLVIKSGCSFRLTSGQVKHTTGGITATVTFGLDATGNPTSCPGSGNYYYKVIWTGPNGNSLTVILPY